MAVPTLFLPIGLPCCGKTTASRRFEAERGALRLTKDEWIKSLHGADNPSEVGDVVEGRLVDIALRVLALGVHVALDFGLWTRAERSALRAAGADAGAQVELWYAPVTPAEQRRRHDLRLAAEPNTTWPITDDEFAEWTRAFEPPTAGELDGSEPIDPPPSGYATWDEWRRRRWPASVVNR